MILYFLSESDCTDRGSFSGQTHEYVTLVKTQIDSSSDRETQDSLSDITTLFSRPHCQPARLSSETELHFTNIL